MAILWGPGVDEENSVQSIVLPFLSRKVCVAQVGSSRVDITARISTPASSLAGIFALVLCVSVGIPLEFPPRNLRTFFRIAVLYGTHFVAATVRPITSV